MSHIIIIIKNIIILGEREREKGGEEIGLLLFCYNGTPCFPLFRGSGREEGGVKNNLLTPCDAFGR